MSKKEKVKKHTLRTIWKVADEKFTYCATSHANLLRLKYPSANVGIIFLDGANNSIKMSCSDDKCPDATLQQIHEMLFMRLEGQLKDDAQIAVFELLKYDIEDNKLPVERRGLFAGNIQFRIFLCVIGFTKCSYLDIQREMHGMCRLMDSPVKIFVKKHGGSSLFRFKANY